MITSSRGSLSRIKAIASRRARRTSASVSTLTRFSKAGSFSESCARPIVCIAWIRFEGSAAARSARSSTAFITRRSELLCSTAARSAAANRRARPSGLRSGRPVSTRIASCAPAASFSPANCTGTLVPSAPVKTKSESFLQASSRGAMLASASPARPAMIARWVEASSETAARAMTTRGDSAARMPAAGARTNSSALSRRCRVAYAIGAVSGC